MRKEVGITIKSKETSKQLEPVRNSYVAIMHQPVTILAQACSQIHLQIVHSLAHLQDVNATLGDVTTSIFFNCQRTD